MSGSELPQPRAAEPEGFAAADGYAALRADVERTLDEARWDKEIARGKGFHVTYFKCVDVIAVLGELLERDDARKEAPHTDLKLSDRGGRARRLRGGLCGEQPP